MKQWNEFKKACEYTMMTVWSLFLLLVVIAFVTFYVRIAVAVIQTVWVM